jgi:hypothetical protein
VDALIDIKEPDQAMDFFHGLDDIKYVEFKQNVTLQSEVENEGKLALGMALQGQLAVLSSKARGCVL